MKPPAASPSRFAAIALVPSSLTSCLAAFLVVLSAGDATAEKRLLSTKALRENANGALAILGLSVVPNETASTLSVESAGGDTHFWASQLGGAFTVSDEVPLYLEGFVGVARYDPTYVLSTGSETETISPKWTSVSGTVGVGWDFGLTDELVLRPIANFSLAHLESDFSLAGRIIEGKTGVALKFLDDGRLDAVGYGGSLMLDWERYREDYEIDVELRYTHIRLQALGESSDVVEGHACACPRDGRPSAARFVVSGSSPWESSEAIRPMSSTPPSWGRSAQGSSSIPPRSTGCRSNGPA